MRRIIERVVTVVTTTTWKISWEADPPHSETVVGRASDDLPSPDVLSETAQHIFPDPTTIQTKEADASETENGQTPPADEPPEESHLPLSEIERKSKP